MPVLQLTQDEYAALKKAEILKIKAINADKTVIIEVSDQELQKIKEAQLIQLSNEEVRLTLSPEEFTALQQQNLFPLRGLPVAGGMAVKLTREQWRLYQQKKLHAKRTNRKQRTLHYEKRIGVCCPECGLIILNYEKMMDHYKSHE